MRVALTSTGTRLPRRLCRTIAPTCEVLEPRLCLSTDTGAAQHTFDLALRAALVGEHQVAQIGDDVVTIRNLSYVSDTGRELLLDVYLPSGESPPDGWPVVLAIHGGGWRRFGKAQYGPRASILTKHGFAVVAPNYTLARAGDPSWPDNLSDLRGAVRWVRSNATVFRFDPTRLAAMGESAGGHLALMLGLVANPSGPSAGIQAVVDFFGPTDLAALARQSPGGAQAARALLGASAKVDPDAYRKASPISYVSPTNPPVLILHGTRDALVPPAQAIKLATALRRAGVSHELRMISGADHGFSLTGRGQGHLRVVTRFLRTSLRID